MPLTRGQSNYAKAASNPWEKTGLPSNTIFLGSPRAVVAAANQKVKLQ